MEARIAEGAHPHTLVTSVSAVDGDLNPGDASLIYSIISLEGRDQFYVDNLGKIN